MAKNVCCASSDDLGRLFLRTVLHRVSLHNVGRAISIGGRISPPYLVLGQVTTFDLDTGHVICP